MIEVTEIKAGPNAGRWSWRINVQPVRTRHATESYVGKRMGIEMSENRARAVAQRQIAWHKQRLQQ